LATNVYEGMFILDSNWYARDPNAASALVQKMIEGVGGEVLASRLWEDRRLAYPIKNRRRGAYWLTYFRLDSAKLNGIYKAINLSDQTLRALLLKVDARIADTLVEHAQSAGTSATEKKEAAEKAAETAKTTTAPAAAADDAKPDAKPEAEAPQEAKTATAVAEGGESTEETTES
jgi:small subunit ribosomal protein S6